MNLNECIDKHSFECYNPSVIIQMNDLQKIKKKEWFKLENPTTDATRTGTHANAPNLNETAGKEVLYTLPDKTLSERLQAITDAYLAEVSKIVNAMNDRYVALVYENVTLKQRIEQMSRLKNIDPDTNYKAKFYDEFIVSDSAFATTTIAEQFGKSAIWLHKFLADHGVIYKAGKHWHMTAEYVKCGYVTQRFFIADANDTVKHAKTTLYWTAKGYEFICKLLRKNGVRKNGTV